LSYFVQFEFVICLIPITAPPEANEAAYSIVSTRAGNPASRKDVDGQFKGEPSKNRSRKSVNAIREAADSNFASLAKLLRAPRL
jgi:hypothetical protein